jgi:hypothetical protein
LVRFGFIKKGRNCLLAYKHAPVGKKGISDGNRLMMMTRVSSSKETKQMHLLRQNKLFISIEVIQEQVDSVYYKSLLVRQQPYKE